MSFHDKSIYSKRRIDVNIKTFQHFLKKEYGSKYDTFPILFLKKKPTTVLLLLFIILQPQHGLGSLTTCACIFSSVIRIGGVMVSVLASSEVDRGFEPRSGQTKDYKIGICWFSAKHVALRRKSKDWLVRNENNVSEWGDMSIRGLLFH